MNRLISAVRSTNPFLLIFLLMGIRYVSVGAQFGDALAFFALCGLFAMDKYVTWKKGPDINADVLRQLEQIKAHVVAVSMKNGLKKDPIETPQPGQRWF